MNLRAGWPAAGWTAPRRPVSEAMAEAPPARGWRRLRTHMRSQYDVEVEVFAAIGCPREPDHPDPPSPLRRSPSAAVNFRNEIVTGPGGLQSKLKSRTPAETQSSSSSKQHRTSHDPALPHSPASANRRPDLLAAGVAPRREQSTVPTTKQGPPTRSPIIPSSPILKPCKHRNSGTPGRLHGKGCRWSSRESCPRRAIPIGPASVAALGEDQPSADRASGGRNSGKAGTCPG